MIYIYNSDNELLPFVKINFANSNIDTSNISKINRTDLIRDNSKNYNKPLSGGSIFPIGNELYLWNRFNRKGFLIKLDIEDHSSKVFKAENHMFLGELEGVKIPQPIGLLDDKFLGFQTGKLELSRVFRSSRIKIISNNKSIESSNQVLNIFLYSIDM